MLTQLQVPTACIKKAVHYIKNKEKLYITLHEDLTLIHIYYQIRYYLIEKNSLSKAVDFSSKTVNSASKNVQRILVMQII